MSEVDISNAGFSIVQDTVYNNVKVFEGLVASGILPQGFRVIVGSVDLSGALGAKAVVDASGNQIILSEGETIAYFCAVESTAVVSGGATTVVCSCCG